MSAPIVVPAARLGSARRLKAGAQFPEPHQCSWNTESGQMDRGSARLLASETLPSLSSVAGPAVVLPDFGKKVPCLTHLWEAGPKASREDWGYWRPGLRRQPWVRQAVCQHRVRKRAVCKPQTMFLKVTPLAAVVKQYNKYEK